MDRSTSVAQPTQPRGRRDTGRQKSEKLSRKRLAWMLGASFAVHSLFTPFPALLGLIGMLAPREVVEEPAVDAIPIDLLEEGAANEPEPEPPEPEVQPSAPLEAPVVEPEAPAAAAPKPEPKKPEPQLEKPEQKKPDSGLADPVAQAGLVGKTVDSNANVRLLLHTSVVREHPLGARVGELLGRTPQWSDFFGAAGVDAVQDIDHVLIAGPPLRDSSNVVAVVQHRLPKKAIEAAFERLVERGGQWVEQSPRIVRVRADRAERLFVAPNAHLVAVVPPSAEKSARALAKNLKFPSEKQEVALSAYVVTPWRVARGTGVKIPESIRWARVSVKPTESGGATVMIQAEDETEELATTNAKKIEKLVRTASTLDLGGGFLGGFAAFTFGSSKQKFIEHIEFRTKGNNIEGKLEITARQLATLLDLLDLVLPPAAKQREKFDPIPSNATESGANVDGAGDSASPINSQSETQQDSPAEPRGAEAVPSEAPAEAQPRQQDPRPESPSPAPESP